MKSRGFSYGTLVVLLILASAIIWPFVDEVYHPFGAPPVLADSTLKILSGDGWGSGVNIGGGYILTAGHVAGTDKSLKMKTSLGVEVAATVLWVNNDYDIALLKIDGKQPSMDSSPLSCGDVKVNQRITAEGNPAVLEFVRTTGMVAGLTRQQGPWKSVVPVDLTVIQGMSGGPVFDDDGNVVGISVGVMGAPLGDMGMASDSGIGFIVPSSAICGLMARS